MQVHLETLVELIVCIETLHFIVETHLQTATGVALTFHYTR
jgi:hypothetical protein